MSERKAVTVSLPVGLSLIDVRPDGSVMWVEIAETPADHALSWQDASERLLVPAFAMIRQERRMRQGQ